MFIVVFTEQNMKPRVQSSRAHSSLPVSPIQRKEKVPSPKQVWQTDEAAKLRTIHEPRPEPQPIKKEISITLTSPQPEGTLYILFYDTAYKLLSD